MLAWRKAGGRKTFALEPEAGERPSPGDKNDGYKSFSKPQGSASAPRELHLAEFRWVGAQHRRNHAAARGFESGSHHPSAFSLF